MTCSTPFGIKDSCTSRRALIPGCSRCAQRLSASKIPAQFHGGKSIRRRWQVLNAFRHQRFLHPASCGAPCRRSGVLNAFRHQRFLHRPTTRRSRPTPTGAQRLSASKIPALRRPRPTCTNQTVLNAFRHQRFLHVRRVIVISSRRSRCSTPFGIKDSCTRGRREGVP